MLGHFGNEEYHAIETHSNFLYNRQSNLKIHLKENGKLCLEIKS